MRSLDEDLELAAISVIIALALVLAGGYLSFESAASSASLSFDLAANAPGFDAKEMASFRQAAYDVIGTGAIAQDANELSSKNPLEKAVLGAAGVPAERTGRLVLSMGRGTALFRARNRALAEALLVQGNADYGAVFLDGSASKQARLTVLEDRVKLAASVPITKDCGMEMESSALTLHTENAPLLKSIALRLSPRAWLASCQLDTEMQSAAEGTELLLVNATVSNETPEQRIVRLAAALASTEPRIEDATDYGPVPIAAANVIRALKAGRDDNSTTVTIPEGALIRLSRTGAMVGERVDWDVSAPGIKPDGESYRSTRQLEVTLSAKKVGNVGAESYRVTMRG